MKSLEEMLPKDHESIQPFVDFPIEPAEPRGFSPEQMVRCDGCLRANAPTRVTCLYCGQPLPLNEAAKLLAKPSLRPLEKWEQGYNNILIPAAAMPDHQLMVQIADLVRMEVDVVARIFVAKRPLPLACTGAAQEIMLLQTRLRDLDVETIVVADADLGLDTLPIRRARALELGAKQLALYDLSGKEQGSIEWSEVSLLVVARLLRRRVELKEKKRSGTESEIVDSSETTADEAVLDIYERGDARGWRVAANSFDFSCLGSRKALITSENFAALVVTLRERAGGAKFDDSFNGLRQLLEPVWPIEQSSQADGWRREGLGTFITSEVVTTTNEPQFTRYSRLLYQLLTRSQGN